MTNGEILAQLSNFPAADRLKILESAVQQLRQDLEDSKTQGEIEAQLARAANALLADYTNDQELTALTALDAEAFRA
jgi:hypothetical protein